LFTLSNRLHNLSIPSERFPTKRRVLPSLKEHLDSKVDFCELREWPGIMLGHYKTNTTPPFPFTCSHYITVLPLLHPLHLNIPDLGPKLDTRIPPPRRLVPLDEAPEPPPGSSNSQLAPLEPPPERTGPDIRALAVCDTSRYDDLVPDSSEISLPKFLNDSFLSDDRLGANQESLLVNICPNNIRKRLVIHVQPINSEPPKRRRLSPVVLPEPDNSEKEFTLMSLRERLSNVSENNLLEYPSILSELDNVTGRTAVQLLDASSQLSSPEQIYINKHKASLLYERLKVRWEWKLSTDSVLTSNLSTEELESLNLLVFESEPLCLDCRSRHPADKRCISSLHGGPSLYALLDTPIPSAVVEKCRFIVYASSSYFKQLDPKNLLPFLNLSPPSFPQLGGSMKESLSNIDFAVPFENRLYYSLLNLINRLGPDCELPLLIEFRPKTNPDSPIKAIISEIENFVRTLEMVQRNYKGLIVSISPIPYWNLDLNLTSYLKVKNFVLKAAIFLMAIGQTLGIYSIFCIVTIFGVKDFPKYFVVKRGDKRTPVFDILGQLTREGKKRLLNSLDSEIRHIIAPIFRL